MFNSIKRIARLFVTSLKSLIVTPVMSIYSTVEIMLKHTDGMPVLYKGLAWFVIAVSTAITVALVATMVAIPLVVGTFSGLAAWHALLWANLNGSLLLIIVQRLFNRAYAVGGEWNLAY